MRVHRVYWGTQVIVGSSTDLADTGAFCQGTRVHEVRAGRDARFSDDILTVRGVANFVCQRGRLFLGSSAKKM